MHAGTRCCALAVCGRGPRAHLGPEGSGVRRCSSLRLSLAAAGAWAGEYCVSPGLWGAGGRPERPHSRSGPLGAQGTSCLHP